METRASAWLVKSRNKSRRHRGVGGAGKDVPPSVIFHFLRSVEGRPPLRFPHPHGIPSLTKQSRSLPSVPVHSFFLLRLPSHHVTNTHPTQLLVSFNSRWLFDSSTARKRKPCRAVKCVAADRVRETILITRGFSGDDHSLSPLIVFEFFQSLPLSSHAKRVGCQPSTR